MVGKPSLESVTRDQRVLFNSVDTTNSIRSDWLAEPADFFRIGPGDTIEIEVLGEPASSATVLVGPDGKVYYSLLTGTFVWGLTLTEAKELLEKNLARFLRDKPEIAVTLRGVGSRRITGRSRHCRGWRPARPGRTRRRGRRPGRGRAGRAW